MRTLKRIPGLGGTDESIVAVLGRFEDRLPYFSEVP